MFGDFQDEQGAVDFDTDALRRLSVVSERACEHPYPLPLTSRLKHPTAARLCRDTALLPGCAALDCPFGTFDVAPEAEAGGGAAAGAAEADMSAQGREATGAAGSRVEWARLSDEQQQAAAALGWSQASWEAGHGASEAIESLPSGLRQCAEVLGVAQYESCGTSGAKPQSKVAGGS